MAAYQGSAYGAVSIQPAVRPAATATTSSGAAGDPSRPGRVGPPRRPEQAAAHTSAPRARPEHEREPGHPRPQRPGPDQRSTRFEIPRHGVAMETYRLAVDELVEHVGSRGEMGGHRTTSAAGGPGSRCAARPRPRPCRSGHSSASANSA